MDGKAETYHEVRIMTSTHSETGTRISVPICRRLALTPATNSALLGTTPMARNIEAGKFENRLLGPANQFRSVPCRW